MNDHIHLVNWWEHAWPSHSIRPSYVI